MPKKIAVVDVLGHTLQVTETDDQLIVQEILPAPFLPMYDLPDRVAANLESAHRARARAKGRKSLVTCTQCGLEKPAALFSEFADSGVCSLCRALARREQPQKAVSR